MSSSLARSTSTSTVLPFSTPASKQYAMTTRPSIETIQPIVTTQSSRNLTYTTFKADVYDYLSWLNGNTDVNQATNTNPVITTESTPSLQRKTGYRSTMRESTDACLFLSLSLCLAYSACLSVPCLHNSTCVVKSKHSFQCICSPSFIGVYCEIGRWSHTFPSPQIYEQISLVHAEILHIAHFRK